MSATHPRCPRCAVDLVAGTAGGMTLHACSSCGGAFLGPACARRLFEALPPEALQLATRVTISARALPDLEAPSPCPACGARMERTRAAATGVELDACRDHGTWFDGGEIQRVARGLRRSGWGGRAQTAAVAGGAVGAGATAAIVMSRPPESGQTIAMVDGGVGTLEVAAAAGEVAGEVAGSAIVEGVFALVGALFEW